MMKKRKQINRPIFCSIREPYYIQAYRIDLINALAVFQIEGGYYTRNQIQGHLCRLQS